MILCRELRGSSDGRDVVLNFRSLLPRFEIAVPGQLFNRPRRCFHPHSRLWSIVGCPFYSGLLSSTLSFFVWALSLGAFLGAFWRSSVYLSPALISFLSARPVSWGEWTGASLLSLFAVSCLGNFCLILGSPPLFYRPFCLFAKLDSLLASSVKEGERERRFSPYVALRFY